MLLIEGSFPTTADKVRGLRMIAALTPEQRKAAIIETSKKGNNDLGESEIERPGQVLQSSMAERVGIA